MRHLHKGVSLAIGLAVLGASLAACGGGGSSSGDSGQIELTIGTFTEFGYESLLTEYQQLHPNIKITHHKTGEGGPYHQNLITKLAAGSGLEDVVAVEEGHFSDIIDKSSKFNDLTEIGPKDVTADRWLSWKYDGGKDKDGKLIGYGTDIGPLAMCYRTDLLSAAGLPTDPASVKAMFASWDSYFAAGQQYVQKTGKPWFDASSQLYNSMVNQLDTGYLDRNDQLTIETNPGIKDAWTRITTAIGQGQSAKLEAFGNEWKTGFQQGAFATTVCPSWMLGVVKEDSGPENAGKWAVTDSFPNGGGNWGGSYLTVPKQSQHPKEAAELAAWLTAPEQQLKAFQAKGNFPSQVQDLTSPELLNQTDAYFGDVKIGQLYATQAQKVTKAQYKGPGDGQIQENVTKPALTAVEQGMPPDQAWQQVVDGAKKIVK
ncbi:carbohydrate ABC transporter substrate-binding protein [Amycolatopsis acidicola]|uniref:Carbohydrate ABC transporter substrate-binding protein n=1 Tax=Amycolatopsis acidicola TaxID=2596893 RepID=A0A5N0USA1_9PSEU|nr:ABC transporter substrate-binding protein [Amycolatopsis acidicola]KAA9153612.1 carbohydrate ABC transporter substrate-binding protein [Amycolatopsis acidicola]